MLYILVCSKCNLQVFQISVETSDGFEISEEQEFELYIAADPQPSFVVKQKSAEIQEAGSIVHQETNGLIKISASTSGAVFSENASDGGIPVNNPIPVSLL